MQQILVVESPCNRFCIEVDVTGEPSQDTLNQMGKKPTRHTNLFMNPNVGKSAHRVVVGEARARPAATVLLSSPWRSRGTKGTARVASHRPYEHESEFQFESGHVHASPAQCSDVRTSMELHRSRTRPPWTAA
jgi:hypothetical protein